MAQITARRPVLTDEDDPLVMSADLPAYGISFSATHLRRLWTRGDFPKPRKISANRLAWRRSWILEWIAERLPNASGEEICRRAGKQKEGGILAVGQKLIEVPGTRARHLHTGASKAENRS